VPVGRKPPTAGQSPRLLDLLGSLAALGPNSQTALETRVRIVGMATWTAPVTVPELDVGSSSDRAVESASSSPPMGELCGLGALPS
jgi:hypothetical protein